MYSSGGYLNDRTTKEFPARRSINPGSIGIEVVSSPQSGMLAPPRSQNNYNNQNSFQGKNLALGHLEELQCGK